MTEYTIGVDLGGTNYRAAAIARDGQMLRKIAGETEAERGREVLIGNLVGAIQTLRQQHTDQRLVGVGVGVPGFIQIAEGLVVGSNNLPFLDNFPLRDDLERRLGTPIILENDANAAALGEKWIGAGRDYNDLVLLTLGTGIGGGIIIDGRVLHGFLGMAGEIGHIVVDPSGNPCGCGNTGCLEKHASATAVEAMAVLLGLGNITSAEVFQLAEQGNDRARMVFANMGRFLGIALTSIINIFNFPIYLLSGGPLPAWEHFAPAMYAELESRCYSYRHSRPKIGKATLGNEAGLYGAAYLPFQAQVPHS